MLTSLVYVGEATGWYYPLPRLSNLWLPMRVDYLLNYPILAVTVWYLNNSRILSSFPAVFPLASDGLLME